jgi:hypothetical protein
MNMIMYHVDDYVYIALLALCMYFEYMVANMRVLHDDMVAMVQLSIVHSDSVGCSGGIMR